ncbi:MAG: glycosyltransferase [Gammaproteobacteria bacterium]|nr:MAG: glycosyltransferase [Gammaproteobacteria bacterium]
MTEYELIRASLIEYGGQDSCVETSEIPTLKNTCAVIISYFPDEQLVSRLRRIQRQLPSMFIVDNASPDKCLSVLRDFSASPSVKLVENSKNEGVGKALNQAASLAREAGFSWMLTLDQDSLIHDDMFDSLVAVYKSSSRHPPLIGSNYRDVSRGRQFLKCRHRSRRNFVERRTVITSGTLLRLDLFECIGGFREDYFIDSVDHEYCLRVRAHGYQVVMSCRELMSHSIGRSGSHGSHLLAFDHPPVRKYYIARNTLVTLRSYFRREPAWAACQLVRLFVEFLSIVLIENGKKSKLIAFSRGIRDAMENKMGHCEWA